MSVDLNAILGDYQRALAALVAALDRCSDPPDLNSLESRVDSLFGDILTFRPHSLTEFALKMDWVHAQVQFCVDNTHPFDVWFGHLKTDVELLGSPQHLSRRM
jgi:hypothetical protein